MTIEVRIAGTGIAFGCRPEETVLAAAERAGYALPYSCRTGVCASCEAGLTQGVASVRGRGEVHAPATGVLLCQTRPRSVLEIAPTRVTRAEPPARRTMTATVHKITFPVRDVAVLALRYPIGKRVRFRAGQYLTVRLPDGDTRNYSMANPPHRNDGALLHVRRVAGGRFSEQLLDGVRPGDPLTVELPFGECTVDPQPGPPIVLIVTGTGFAPAKSIIEAHIHRGCRRPLHLYWGGSRARDLYLGELAAKWASRYRWFRFTPVLSEPDTGWSQRTGPVHRAVLADHPDLRDHHVYACGNPAMTEAARADLTAVAGLPDTHFHCDAFVPTGAGESALAPTLSQRN